MHQKQGDARHLKSLRHPTAPLCPALHLCAELHTLHIHVANVPVYKQLNVALQSQIGIELANSKCFQICVREVSQVRTLTPLVIGSPSASSPREDENTVSKAEATAQE